MKGINITTLPHFGLFPKIMDFMGKEKVW